MGKMFKLTTAVRLMLLMNLPDQGSVVDMITKRNISKKIDFSSEEMERLKITSKDGKISWAHNEDPKEVEFTENEISFIKTIIEKLDSSQNITDNILDFASEILGY